ncbi:MAG: hypothetical protein SF070_03135 [Gemmatimonadota bacterium]|nr:hypothetical protein [Gemmatimonadota bacterium]
MLLVQAVDSGPSVGQLVAIMVGVIPILGIMGWTAVKILGPITQAFARRIGSGAESGGEVGHRVEELALEVEQLRAQLAETHERLDFTERLLAQHRAPEQLPRG